MPAYAWMGFDQVVDILEFAPYVWDRIGSILEPSTFCRSVSFRLPDGRRARAAPAPEFLRRSPLRADAVRPLSRPSGIRLNHSWRPRRLPRSGPAGPTTSLQGRRKSNDHFLDKET